MIINFFPPFYQQYKAGDTIECSGVTMVYGINGTRYTGLVPFTSVLDALMRVSKEKNNNPNIGTEVPVIVIDYRI